MPKTVPKNKIKLNTNYFTLSWLIKSVDYLSILTKQGKECGLGKCVCSMSKNNDMKHLLSLHVLTNSAGEEQ